MSNSWTLRNRRKSQRRDDRPQRKSVRDLPPDAFNDLVQCPGDLFGSDQLRYSSVPGLGTIRTESEVRRLSALPLTHTISGTSSKAASGRQNSVLEDIRDAQQRLSRQLSEEADELRMLMEVLSDAVQIVHSEIASLRKERNDSPRSPIFAPSALRMKSDCDSGKFPNCRSELLARRLQKTRESTSRIPELKKGSLEKWSIFGDNGQSNLFMADAASKAEARRTSNGALPPVMADQAMLGAASSVVSTITSSSLPRYKVNPVFIGKAPRCGQDEPIVCSSLDFDTLLDTKAPCLNPHQLACDQGATEHGIGLEVIGQTSPRIEKHVTLSTGLSSYAPSQTRTYSDKSRLRASISDAPSDKVSCVDFGRHTGFSVFAHRRFRMSRRFIMFPDSPRRNFWDVCSFAVLIFDCITIPYNIAWRPPKDSGFVLVGTWATMIFWTIDMLLSFNTAYYVGADLETRRLSIVKHYLRTSFTFDALATGCDWLMTILEFMPDAVGSGDTNFASMLRFVKAQRALRVARFLRVSSMWSRLEQIHYLFLTDAWQMVTQVISMLFGLFLVNHITCCFWYAIGKDAWRDTGLTWLDITENVDGVSKTYADYTAFYQYVTSYHWSVVQMFVGSTQINATNSSERIYNIFCNLFGALFSAAITSWFSALLVKYQQQHSDLELVMKSIRRYLRLNKVSASLSARVQKQLSTRLSVRKRDTENDIDAFKLLSKLLRAELRFSVAHDVLLASPMIMLLENFDHSVALHIALAFEYQELQSGDELFEAMTPIDAAYGIIRGCLIYTFQGVEEDAGCRPTFGKTHSSGLRSQFPHSADHTLHTATFGKALSMNRGHSGITFSTTQAYDGTLCEEGDWIAEAALWVRDWQTRGLMECYGESELVVLDGERFQNACGRHGKIHALLAAYAKSYADLLKNERNERECELTDIAAPVDHPVVIMSMDTRDRMVAAEPVLLQLRAQEDNLFSLRSRPKKGADVLEKEVKSGECSLILDKYGNVSRIASVVLLRAERPDGLVLIQVAKLEDGLVTAKLQMPATKMKDGEGVTEAAERILKKNLSQFGGAQAMGKQKRDSAVKPTEGYGMDTCFYRTQIHVPFEKSSITPPRIYFMNLVCKSTTMEGSVAASADSRLIRSIDTRGLWRKPSVSKSLASGSGRRGLDDVMPDELYFVRSGPESGTIYAWMVHMTFSLLGEEENQKQLDEYVSHLQIPDDLDELCGPWVSPRSKP